MAQFSRVDVLIRMEKVGIIPVFYNPDFEVAKKVITACAAGGAKVIEFTNRGDFAFEVFAKLVKYFIKEDPSIIMGIGSISDPYTAALYINNGANFIVGPVFNPEVAKICNRRKIAYSPGCGSASEISLAEEYGVDIVKVFPGEQVGGPAFVKSILGPSPWTKIMPTGGVSPTEESINAWVKAGVVCMGMGSNLISADLLKNNDYDAITTNVKNCLTIIRKARKQSVFVGIEHIGFYENESGKADEVTEFYSKNFDMEVTDLGTANYLKGSDLGWVEVIKAKNDVNGHIAILVEDFDEAIAVFNAKGIEVGEALDTLNGKAAFLKELDPMGNLVHIVWRA